MVLSCWSWVGSPTRSTGVPLEFHWSRVLKDRKRVPVQDQFLLLDLFRVYLKPCPRPLTSRSVTAVLNISASMLTSLATAKQARLLNKTGSGEDSKTANELRHVAAPFSIWDQTKRSVSGCCTTTRPHPWWMSEPLLHFTVLSSVLFRTPFPTLSGTRC